MERALFVLCLDVAGVQRVKIVTIEGTAFENRASLAKAWCRLSDDELITTSNIAGGKFVHRNGFVGGNERH